MLAPPKSILIDDQTGIWMFDAGCYAAPTGLMFRWKILNATIISPPWGWRNLIPNGTRTSIIIAKPVIISPFQGLHNQSPMGAA